MGWDHRTPPVQRRRRLSSAITDRSAVTLIARIRLLGGPDWSLRHAPAVSSTATVPPRHALTGTPALNAAIKEYRSIMGGTRNSGPETPVSSYDGSPVGAAAGDPIVTLFESMRPDLLRFAHWLARDRALAEDIVQEALLRAWRSRDALKEQ